MVAVKILHDAEVGSMNFVREIAILKGCRHSNIVQFQVCCAFCHRSMLLPCNPCLQGPSHPRLIWFRSITFVMRQMVLCCGGGASLMHVTCLLAGGMRVRQQDNAGDGVCRGRRPLAKSAAAGHPGWELALAWQEGGPGYCQGPVLPACTFHCVSPHVTADVPPPC